MKASLTPFEAFELAVSRTESESDFARRVGCTPGNINQLLKRKSPLSHRYVLRAEEETGVSRHLLRPDLYPDETAAEPTTAGQPGHAAPRFDTMDPVR